LDKIGRRVNSDRTFKASLHGLELKSPNPSNEKGIDLTDDQKKAMAIALQRAKERKRAEYGSK